MKVNLVLFKKDGHIKKFSLPSTVTIIGRRKDCDMCIPLMSISRRHCELNMDQGRLTIRDLGSKNGCFLNGTRISESALKAGDKLKIGKLDFGIQIDGQPEDLETMRPEGIPPAKVVKKEETVSGSQAGDVFEDIFSEFSDLDRTIGNDPLNL